MEARTEECESFTPACLYCCWHKCPAQGTGERKGQSLAVCPETRFQPTENFQLPNSRYVFSWEIFFKSQCPETEEALCVLSFAPSVPCKSHRAVRWVAAAFQGSLFLYSPLHLFTPPGASAWSSPPRHSAFDSKKDKWNYLKLVREELPSRFTSPHP